MQKPVEEHVELVHRDDYGAKLGMWLFLATELLLFSALFTAYIVFRNMYPAEFHKAHLELNPLLGLVNSIILFFGGLTAVLAITSARRNNLSLIPVFSGLTLLSGIAFLIVKAYEYSVKVSHGLFFGTEHFNALPMGERIFFSLYYVSTGIHATHVLIGVLIYIFITAMALRGAFNSENYIRLEIAGLYWALVDMIWIYLFPLLYLIP